MFATFSPAKTLSSKISISPPIFFTTSITPALVGFIPTFFNVISEFGTIKPATIKNEAEDISPTISISRDSNSLGKISVFTPFAKIFAPKYSSIISV